MKPFFTILLVSLFTAFAFAQTPIAEYHFNGGGIYDETTNGNNLTVVGEIFPGPSADGEANRAAIVSQSYLQNDDVSALNMNNGITVSGWFNLAAFNGEWTALINKWNGELGGYYLGINSANRRVRWNVSVDNIEDSESMPLGTWVHYAASYDGAELKLYRDGELINSTVATGTLGSNEFPFMLGAQSNLTNLNYNGFIDEVYVYGSALGDEEVQDLYQKTYEALDKDLVFLNMGLEKLQASTNPNNKLEGSFFNNGLEVITDFSVELTKDGNTTQIDFENLNIQPYETFNITETIPLEIGVGESVAVNAEILNINGGEDDVEANNSQSEEVQGLYFIPKRKVVLEEGTGTWCGWCPRGAVALERLQEKYPDQFIGIAVHNGDVMTVPEYDSEIGFSGYPNCHVDRTILRAGISPDAGEVYMQDRLHPDNTPLLGVSQKLSYDEASRTVDIEVTVRPALPLSGDHRVSIVILEDGINETSPEYEQSNFYASGAQGPMGGYELLANPVPAFQMTYDHVARAVVGGVRGLAGSLPDDMTYAEEYNYTTTYTVPGEYDVRNMYVVALVLDANSEVILNAEKSSMLNSNVAVNDIDEVYDVALYPNPTDDSSFISLNLSKRSNVQVSISDLSGKQIAFKNYGQLHGDQILPINTTKEMSGLYLINLQVDGQQIVKKLMVK